ncbi:MAG: VWA domain-containing protein [Actinomycetota bacterium]|nr:VWA domain-containing protein [Actinomycetota bacterium]
MALPYRYGAFHDGPDPLAAPFDVRRALDELGDDVLRGDGVRDALRNMLRRGTEGWRGLDDLLRDVRRRRRSARQRGRLDGTLEEVRALLDRAVGQERAELFPDPSDDARLREAELDALPSETARAVRELSSYDWRSSAARATYEQIQDLLRREVLDSQFRGMKQALESPDPAAMRRVKDMLADLNAMLDADARGEHRQADFDDFMAKHGEFFPDRPENLEQLVDSLARRAAAAQRLLNSLTPEQREELRELMADMLGNADLEREMAQLSSALQSRRGDLDWSGRANGMSGRQPLGMGDATTALEDLADLEELESALGQDYPGARLDDIDDEAVRRALGRGAVDDLETLRQIERELEANGYLRRSGDRLELTPKAVRRLGQTALRRVFADLERMGRGSHDVHDAGAAGEATGATREWHFGDEQPIDTIRTLGNAVRREASTRSRVVERSGAIRLTVDDFEVVETERRTSAAVCLLVDLSYSMVLRDTFGAAKSTALALHALVSGQFPNDAVQIIGFSSYARVLDATELAGLEADMVQGTNLQHALMLAGRFLDKHADAEPVVLVVTDGEPTAHLLPNGRPWFAWPPERETITATVAEVDRMTRRGATLNVFLLDDDPSLEAFVQEVARRNGGRVLSPSPERLGNYVVSDYLRRRRGGRAR